MTYRVGFLAVLLTLAAVSCTRNFDELNENPNAITNVDPDFLFTQAVARSVEDFSIGAHTEIWSLSVWVQHMADSAGVSTSGSEYAYGNDWNEEVWQRWWADAIMPLKLVEDATADDPFLINKHAQARIWKVWVIHRLTDLYGDIPYSEALTALNDDPNFLPAYDSQQAVYADLLNELSEAVAQMDDAQGTFGAADPIYAGDNTAWKKFANALRLRLALRISDADATLAEQHAREVLQSDFMIEALSEGAHFRFQNGTESPFFLLDESGQGMRNPSQYFVELLKATNDPRLAIYAEPTPFSQIVGTPDYQGIPNLLSKAELNDRNITAFTTSLVGEHFLQIDWPGTQLGYSEVCFLRAEAAMKGWESGTTQSWYQAGVEAHMQWLGVADTAITDYLAGPGAFDNTMEQLMTQKWISFAYTDAYEAFAEYRRTGFPVLTDVDGNPVNTAEVPKRLPYPLTETSLNSDNVNAVGSGVNDNQSPVWWDR